MEGASFSSDGVEVLSRKVQCVSAPEKEAKAERELSRYYEIERCTEFVTSNSFHRVALQFPDSLLHDAARVAALLAQETSELVFILGDTSYGSCCVDEIAAEHNGADCIIHFGASCLTRTRRLPVLFIFGKEGLDVADCERGFRETFASVAEERVLVMFDTVYAYAIDELRELIADYKNCVVSLLSVPSREPRDSVSRPHHPCVGSCECERSCTHCRCCQCCDGPGKQRCQSPVDRSVDQSCSDGGVVGGNGHVEEATRSLEKATVDEPTCEASLDPNYQYDRFGRSFQLKCPVEEYKVFYIGSEGATLTNLILKYSKCQFFSYDPTTRVARQETLNTNKTLGRRYFLVQKAKEARTVGILVGTLGAADYMKIIERLKKIMKQAGKKYYTVAVGKLNVPKMANFLEIDLFVLVACPENSLVDSQEFYKPVVTPFEMEIACIRSKEWTGDYSTDYQELLPGAAFHTCLSDGDVEVEPEFSLISGGFVPTKENSEPEEGHQKAVVPRSKMEIAVSSTAAAFLGHRSWQGLEQKLGETEAGAATEGRTGVPIAYTHEKPVT